MADLLRKPSGTTGKVHDITAQSANWGYVGFGLYHLKAGEAAAEPTGAEATGSTIEVPVETPADTTAN